MGDCVFGALAMMLKDEVGAASDGGNTGVSIGGYDKSRRPFIFVDFACGSWGGRPWGDGVQGNSNMFANMASQSVELIESQNPIQILRYELIPDRAGAGNIEAVCLIAEIICSRRKKPFCRFALIVGDFVPTGYMEDMPVAPRRISLIRIKKRDCSIQS